MALCLMPFFLSAPARSADKADAVQIPLGSWHYGIYLVGKRIGTADTSTVFENGNYQSGTSMAIEKNNKEQIFLVREAAVETADFAPVSYSYSTTIVSGSRISRMTLGASFNNGTVTLKDADGERTVKLDGAFSISANIYSLKLLCAGLKPGTEIKGKIYDPTTDEETLLDMSEKVVGTETVTLPSGKINLIHTVMTVGAVRNIHNYMDARGVVYKTSLSMMNQNIDLLLESSSPAKAK